MTPGEPVKFAKACHMALNELGMLLITKCSQTEFLVTLKKKKKKKKFSHIEQHLKVSFCM